jgi:hypothetical protein
MARTALAEPLGHMSPPPSCPGRVGGGKSWEAHQSDLPVLGQGGIPCERMGKPRRGNHTIRCTLGVPR